MQHREFDPPEMLVDTIKCFWYNRGDFGEEESDFKVMPDGYAEIIFYFGSPIHVLKNGILENLPSPFIMGLLNQPMILRTKNTLQIIGIRCFPWTVFDLLGLPSGKEELRLFDHPVTGLQPVLNEFIQDDNVDDAILQVEKFFLDAKSKIGKDSLLYKAGLAMSYAKGSMPVNQVAAAAHATVRTLERKFKQSSGHTVKDVSGLMRFEQVRNRLWQEPTVNLAGLAHELGYTDQSHLSKEFKRFSGSSPAAFAKNAKRVSAHRPPENS